ncbi:ABC transporter permease [Oribacterium sp. WCC10]|uniref:ABC transporter permease n=1 Tax=Oribacterium sp. WCC10 TaxID=1855343 RepID=UPI0008EF6F50|nr:ABC transporter permease [Oribacterium sp. WCC10]SFG61903.1 ABC-2 type transporter [Oribacterium sp. WCC10]
MADDIMTRHHTGRLRQIHIYLGKLFRIFINERGWKGLPLSAAIALLVAFVMGKNLFTNMERLQSGAFAIVCVCIWNGFFNSIQVVCRERAIIKREHRAGLHITAYIGAHMIYQAIMCLTQVVISIAIYKWYGIAFPKESIVTGNFTLDFGITLWIITYSADMMALMISCIVKTTTAAMTVMPFMLIIQLVFAGVIFSFSSGPAQYIEMITLSHWGTIAICSVADYNQLTSHALFSAIYQFRSVPEIQSIVDYIQRTDIRYKMDVLSARSMQKDLYAGTISNILKCWGILLLIGAVAIIIGTLCLEMIDRDKR